MAQVKITSEGEGQDTRITVNGKPVADCVSVVWMVHGRHGRAKCSIGYKIDKHVVRFMEFGENDTIEVAVKAEVPDDEVHLREDGR